MRLDSHNRNVAKQWGGTFIEMEHGKICLALSPCSFKDIKKKPQIPGLHLVHA